MFPFNTLRLSVTRKSISVAAWVFQEVHAKIRWSIQRHRKMHFWRNMRRKPKKTKKAFEGPWSPSEGGRRQSWQTAPGLLCRWQQFHDAIRESTKQNWQSEQSCPLFFRTNNSQAEQSLTWSNPQWPWSQHKFTDMFLSTTVWSLVSFECKEKKCRWHLPFY